MNMNDIDKIISELTICTKAIKKDNGKTPTLVEANLDKMDKLIKECRNIIEKFA